MKTHVIAVDRKWRIEFYIDFETGEFEPVGDERTRNMTVGTIRTMAAEVENTGRIGAAWQQDYPAKNPLRDPASMALALYCNGYSHIEGALSKYPFPQRDETPEGAVN